MYNLSVIASANAESGDVVYRWVLTRTVGKKVIPVARVSHGYGRRQDAIRAFENLEKLFNGTSSYTKNYG